MEYKAGKGLALRAVNAHATEQVLERRAHELAPGVTANTRVRSRQTKESTRVETGHRSSSGDRPAVWIVQEGAAVPENFRQNRDYMIRGLGAGA